MWKTSSVPLESSLTLVGKFPYNMNINCL